MPDTHAALKRRIAVLEEENNQLLAKVVKKLWVFFSQSLLRAVPSSLWHVHFAVSIVTDLKDEPFAGLSILLYLSLSWFQSMTTV